MTAPAATFCVLCSVVHDRQRRAVAPPAGLALCITCRASCDRGDGVAEAERRSASLPAPDESAAIMERAGLLHSLGVARTGG